MTPRENPVAYWNDPAVTADVLASSMGVHGFAEEVQSQLRPQAQIVELGSGTGEDAAYFAENGHSVVAYDISESLVDLSSQRYANLTNLRFQCVDISKSLPVGAESCDVVYSRLSLHYFNDEVTRRIFSEVHWILRPTGRFFFLVRSTDDPMFGGKGVEIEHNVFDYDGKVRHFFDREYALDLLEDTGFSDIGITTGSGKYHKVPWGWLKAVATRP